MLEDYKEDLRVVRTRKLLCEALFDLLENQPFEKITVMDICDRAMVHRATFYNHFEDKEHLLEYAIDEIKEALFSASIEKEDYSSPKEMYMSLIATVIDFVEKNKMKILLILGSNSLEKATELLLTTIKRSVSYLTRKNKYKENYAIPVYILIDFLTGGITNLGLSWIKSPSPCTKEELLHYFDVLLNEKIFLKQ